jgi:hypothetical protein
MTVVQEKDAIPRLQHLVPHMRDQLLRMRQPANFEQLRFRYIDTVDRLVIEGKGRRTASRVGDRDAYWAPTTEVLTEAMRLGFVQRQPLPSARRYLDTYRDRHYLLTEEGAALADVAEVDSAAFYDAITEAVYAAHPYFRRLVDLLTLEPLLCPEVSEGDVEDARRQRKALFHWTEYALEVIGGRSLLSREEASSIISAAVTRRFKGERPSGKALAETLNDAFATVAASARGLPIGATDLNILRQWGMQLRLLDQSRYVPGYSGTNVIWLAADIDETRKPSLRRRGLSENLSRAADAVLQAYRDFTAAADTSLAAPYAPIYTIRAAAAFQCGLTRTLIDMVIERLADGSLPNQTHRLLLHLGTTHQPASEPLFRRGGSRRYEMTVHKA